MVPIQKQKPGLRNTGNATSSLCKTIGNGAGLPVLIESRDWLITLCKPLRFLNFAPSFRGGGMSTSLVGRPAMFRCEGSHSNHGVRPSCRIICQIKWVLSVIASDLNCIWLQPCLYFHCQYGRSPPYPSGNGSPPIERRWRKGPHSVYQIRFVEKVSPVRS